MNERDFDLILALHEQKNITRTAEKMFLTQPAVTHRIKRIEEFLGGEILIRSQKGVVFTPLGEEIIPYARKARANLRDMKDLSDATRGEVRGTLRLGLSVNFAHYRLPALLKRYTAQFPQVKVNIVTERSTHVFRLLQKDEISLAIIREDFDWPEGKRPLFTESICIAYHEQVSGEDLHRIPYIGYKTDLILRRRIDTWLNDHRHSARDRSIWADNMATCKELVRQGIGWSLLPEISLGDFEGYREPAFFADGKPFLRKTSALFRKAHGKLPQVREFLNLLS